MMTESPVLTKIRNNITVSFSSNVSSIDLYKNNTFFQKFTNNSNTMTTFSNLPNGSYYAIATESGKDSSVKSNSVTVAVTPSPTASVGSTIHTIDVTGFASGAIVGLYRASGGAVTELTVNATSHTFTGVQNGDYIVKAKNPNQEISDASNLVTINVQTTSTPIASISRRDVIISDFPTGTQIKLYNSENNEVASKIAWIIFMLLIILIMVLIVRKQLKQKPLYK